MTPSNPEQIILIDARNRAVGRGEKHEVRQLGLLHRAFSVFLYDAHHRMLLQKRHPLKYHILEACGQTPAVFIRACQKRRKLQHGGA